MNGKCKSCNYCKILYRRGAYDYFYILKNILYYCTLQAKIVGVDGVCEKWIRKRAEYDVSAQRFYRVEEDIKFLLKIFENK